jgi:hypothetical protein
MLLSSDQLSRPDQLLMLANNLPSIVEHILLQVVHPWDPRLLLSPITPLPSDVFPTLKRLYFCYHLLSEHDRPAGLIDMQSQLADARFQFSNEVAYSYRYLSKGSLYMLGTESR